MATESKNRNKKVGIGLMVVTTCIVVTGLCAVLAIPESALAKKPDEPPGTAIYFDVLLGVADEDIFMVNGSGIEGRIESGGGGTNVDRMIVNRPSPHIDITSVIDELDSQGVEGVDDCFDVLLDDETGRYIGVKGTLLIELPDRAVNEMMVAYSFQAKDKKGKDVYYTIRTTGTLTDLDDDGDVWGGVSEWIAVQDAVNDGTADPEYIPNFFVQITVGTSWTLSSQKFACTGSGSFNSGFGIRIANPRSDSQNNTL